LNDAANQALLMTTLTVAQLPATNKAIGHNSYVVLVFIANQ
jgi:hypothetical protein